MEEIDLSKELKDFYENNKQENSMWGVMLKIKLVQFLQDPSDVFQKNSQY